MEQEKYVHFVRGGGRAGRPFGMEFKREIKERTFNRPVKND